MTDSRPHDHQSPHLAGDCPHARRRAESAESALAQARAWCESRGVRLTPIRADVLAALLRTHHPMSAYDLIEQTASDAGRRLAPVSIYRALDFLIAEGLAHRLESRNAFIACPCQHRPGEPVVFLICERCGGVDEAVCEDLGRALKALAEREGFSPSARIVELAGSCAHCRAPSPS